MKKLLTIVTLFIMCSLSYSQVGIGTTTPDPSAILDITTTEKGLLIPRMTLTEKNAIPSPATGLLVYQTDGTTGFWYYNGASWTTFTSSGWSLTGDVGTNPTINFLGTTDNQDFVIATNNTERIRFQADGDIGIGENNPSSKLHITGAAPAFRLVDDNQGINKVLTSDANGFASWGSSAALSTGDDDWRFSSGNTISDPIYHPVSVVIGRTGTTTHEIDIDNGANTGTTMGIGDVEYLEDGNNETRFSHQFVPDFDNSIDLGSSTNRWRTIYAINGTIQTSDGRDKTNITPLPYGIKDLMKLQTVQYNWKEEKYLNHIIPEDKKELKLGLLAQQTQKIIPEVVYDYTWKPKSEKERDTYVKVANEYLGINYEELLAVLVKSKQDQQKELVVLKQQTETLLKRIQQLKNK